jgi:hypothetical protein
VPRQSDKKKADINKRLWEQSNGSSRQKWQRVNQRGYDFYLNEQLTSAERDAIESSGMPSFIINRITPVIEMMKYFVSANNPRWQAVGTEGSDTEVGAVHSDIADYCWYLSNGKSIYSHIIQDALTKSVGYCLIDVNPDLDQGMGEVVFKRVEPFDVFVDPMSTDFLFRDASYVIIKKDLTKTQLMALYPDYKRKIKKAEGQTMSSRGGVMFSDRNLGTSDAILSDEVGVQAYNPATAEEDEMLEIFETYQKIKVPYYNVYIKVLPSPDEMRQIKQQAEVEIENFIKETEVSVKETEASVQQAVDRGEMIPERATLEIEKAQQEAELSIEQYRQQIISKIVDAQSRVENQVLEESVYKELAATEVGQENIVEAVKFFDTRVRLTCTIGSSVLLWETVLPCTEYPIVPFMYTWTGTPYPMSAVSPLVGKQQELNKAHQLMIHNANLASNLRWLYEEGSVPEDEWEQYSSAPGALLKYRSGFAPPTPVQPLPLNQAFFELTSVGRSDMEYLSGIYSSMQGDVGTQHETYRGLLAADEYGTRRIKAWMEATIEPALEHLGRCFKEMAQSTYTAHKVFRIVQPSALQEERTVEMNIPIYNDLGAAIGKWKDYGTARFDIRIVAGSTLPVNRWALLEEYFRWFQAGLIDDVAMLAETDVRGKENIMKRKSVYSQLQSQLEEMEQVLKDREGTIETLSRQVIQSGIRTKIKDAESEVDRDIGETKSQQKYLRNMLRGELDLMKREMSRQIKNTVEQEKIKQKKQSP